MHFDQWTEQFKKKFLFAHVRKLIRAKYKSINHLYLNTININNQQREKKN